jgi:hypothetical protein
MFDDLAMSCSTASAVVLVVVQGLPAKRNAVLAIVNVREANEPSFNAPASVTVLNVEPGSNESVMSGSHAGG